MNSTIALGESSIHSFKELAGNYWSQSSWWQIVLALIIIGLTYDQVMYQYRKGLIAGPAIKFWPIIGPFLESLDPKFDEYKAKWDLGKLSCVLIFHKFVIIASDRDLSRKIFAAKQYVKPCVVDVATKILRPENWVFLDGKQHSDYRKGLNGLFRQQALETYIHHQELIIDKYLDRFQNYDSPKEFFPEFREFLCAISLRTFCGDYIQEEQIALIADNYYKVTAALELVNFPIIIPYTKTWYGKQIADSTMKIFEECAAQAKKHIANGGEPTCVMDEWIFLMKQAKEGHAHDENEGAVLVRNFTNKEISEAIFTFLFASQDASSSLACWVFQIVADRKDVQKKIREEQLRVRGGDPTKRLTLDLINEMTYTNKVVRETLRYRPPVIMVPYVCKQDFPVTENYTARKGSMLIPSLYPALHDPEVYPQPDEFIPERWDNPTKEMSIRNWLPFGTGPHVCLGKNYVLMLFTGMLGKMVMNSEIIHHVTELSEEIKVFATIFPKDDLILEWKKRDPSKVDA